MVDLTMIFETKDGYKYNVHKCYVKVRVFDGGPPEQWRLLDDRTPGKLTLTPETACRILGFRWIKAPARGVFTSMKAGNIEVMTGAVPIDTFVDIVGVGVVNVPILEAHTTFELSYEVPSAD